MGSPHNPPTFSSSLVSSFPLYRIENATCTSHGLQHLFHEATCATRLPFLFVRKNMTYVVSPYLPPYCSYSESLGGTVWNQWFASSRECSSRSVCICTNSSSSLSAPPPFPPVPTTYPSPPPLPPLECDSDRSKEDGSSDTSLCTTCKMGLYYLYTNTIAFESYWPWLPEAWRNESDLYWNGGCQTYTTSHIIPYLTTDDGCTHEEYGGTCRALYDEVRCRCECLLQRIPSPRVPTINTITISFHSTDLTPQPIPETSSRKNRAGLVVLSLSFSLTLALIVGLTYSRTTCPLPSPPQSSSQVYEEREDVTSSSPSTSPALASKDSTQIASDPTTWSEA